MTPAEHYREAERLIVCASDRAGRGLDDVARDLIQVAQVHATLAHAGALVQAHSIAIRGLADPGESRHGHTPRDPSEWHAALYGGAS